jgi:hypothetical protein
MSRTFFVFVVAFLFVIPLIFRLEIVDREIELIDLGVARYPADVGGADRPARVAVHDWREAERGDTYRLAYAHGHQAGARLEADHDRLGRRFGFAWEGDETFRWRIPSECQGQEWTCIYSEVITRSQADLEPMLIRIEEAFHSENPRTWTKVDAAAWLLAFVQQIPYKLPTEHAFGVLPPALVVSQDWGDCDSKSLLLIHLLERLGIEAVLLVSQAHAHALVGIDVLAGRSGFRHGRREYAWAETTSEEAPLGWLHPRMRLPNDWRIVPIR